MRRIQIIHTDAEGGGTNEFQVEDAEAEKSMEGFDLYGGDMGNIFTVNASDGEVFSIHCHHIFAVSSTPIEGDA